MNKKMYVIMGIMIMVLFTGVSCNISTNKSDNSLPKENKLTTEKTKQEQQKIETSQQITENSVVTATSEKQIEKTKELVVTPVTKTESTIVSCGTDENCLLKNIQSCTPATGQIQIFTAIYSITVTDAGNNCVVRHTAKSGLGDDFASWVGKYYDCTFTKKELAQNVKIYNERAINSPTEYCKGPYIDALNDFMNGTGSPQETYSSETLSVNVGDVRADGKTISVTAIESANGPATIKVDSESKILKINETATINGYSITLLEIVPQTCTIDGVKKEGTDCGMDSPYRAKLNIK